MRRTLSLVLGLVLVAGVARAADDEDDDPSISPHPIGAVDPAQKRPPARPFTFREATGWRDLSSKVDVSGYLLPQFQIVSLQSALPRDKTQYGAKGTRAGFAIHGSPWQDFTYIAHVVLAPAGVENVVLLSPAAGPSIGFTLPTSTGASIDFEEVTLGYRPEPWVQIKAGFLRVPFSLGQTTPIPKQMFPFRPPVTGEIQSGADAALLGTFRLLDARLVLNAAMFLGASLGGSVNPNQSVRGPAFLASVAAHPLGMMSMREGDESRGPFRFALGVSSIYRRATAFDPTGYEASNFDDVRLSAFARASVRGFYAQAEYLRRNRSDDDSGSPNRSEGFYAEASYYQPLGPHARIALGPLLRAGQIETSADFAPRTFRSFEAGVAFYPHARGAEPERLRIILEYFLARTSPLDETQHEGLAQLQLEF